jgi:hypothetical protein
LTARVALPGRDGLVAMTDLAPGSWGSGSRAYRNLAVARGAHGGETMVSPWLPERGGPPMLPLRYVDRVT